MSQETARTEIVSRAASSMRPLLRFAAIALLAIGATGCAIHHPVTFENATYTSGARQQPATVMAVIDQATLDRKVPVRAVATGYANIWEIQPGDMLKQVADIELPQMFSGYALSTSDQPPPGNGPGVVLALTIPSYTFENYHAAISVNAVSKTRDGQLLFNKTYSGEGSVQSGKMVVGGAFAMKSAIRQSSLDAYKQIFIKMRADLEQALAGQRVSAR